MIKIKNLHLENFRGFIDTSIDFGKKITCIAGVNGAGKSSCLEALSKSLHALLRPVLNPKFEGVGFQDIKESDINVNSEKKYSSISLSFDCNNTNYSQKIDSDREITKNFKSSIIASKIKNDFTVVAYYTINRSDLDIDVSVESERDLSEKTESVEGALAPVIHYKDFFRWFRDREDRENQEIVSRFKKQETLAAYEDHALKAVRKSISALLPNVSQMTVDRKKLVLFINKGDSVLDFSTLSDGEKGIITLFGDIARRLAIANETLENPLEGNGIILIDEIELHLHPSWQRKVCKALKETFPNCQFIITTHSPQVLGELKTEEIWLLNDFNVYRPDSSYGLTSNEILDEIMNVIDDDTSLSRDSEIAKKLNEVSTLVELEKFNAAKKVIEEIEKITGGEIHETVKYKTVIEMIGED